MAENTPSLDGMSGILYSPDSKISSLRNLLNETYKDENAGITLIKEILQNADDAGATEVTVTQVPAIEEPCDNPLLRRAGIIIANNGAFSDDNRKAFLTFSDSDKAQESGKVGRFGLGRFSMFHRTEAIFYWGSDGLNDYKGCYSPWIHEGNDTARTTAEKRNQPAAHTGWDRWNEATIEFLVSRLRSVAPEFTDSPATGFAMFLPSRENGDSPILVDKIRPELSRLIDSDSQSTQYLLASIMPQLRSVKKLIIRETKTADANAVKSSILKITRTSGEGLTRPQADAPNPTNRDSEGVIEVETGRTGSQNRRSFAFRILERAGDPDGDFASLKQQDGWPKITESSISYPQKALPHGAVTAFTNPEGSGLNIRLAVFLPLHDGSKYPQVDQADAPIKIQAALQITLHGYFFIDSGRKEIKFDDEQTANDWNRQILRRLTLPSVIPSLTSALNKLDWKTQSAVVKELPAKVEAVFGDRSASPRSITQDLLSWITEDLQLVTGPGWHEKYESIEATIPCIRVSPPKADTLLAPLKRMAAQMRSEAKVCLIWQGEPALQPPSAGNDWSGVSGTASAETFAKLLAAEIDSSEDPTLWLPILLDQIKTQNLPRPQGKALLLQLFRAVAGGRNPEVRLALPEDIAIGFKAACEACGIRLINGTPEAVAFACKHSDALQAADVFFQVRAPDPNSVRLPKVPWDPIRQIILAIPEASIRSNTASQPMVEPDWVEFFKTILKNLNEDEQAELRNDPKISDLPILSATNGRGESKWHSLSEFESLKIKQLLYKGTPDSTAKEVLGALQKREEVWFANKQALDDSLPHLKWPNYCKILEQGLFPSEDQAVRSSAAVSIISDPTVQVSDKTTFALKALLCETGWSHDNLRSDASKPIVVSDKELDLATKMQFERWKLIDKETIRFVHRATSSNDRTRVGWQHDNPIFVQLLDGIVLDAQIKFVGVKSAFNSLSEDQREEVAVRLLKAEKLITGLPLFRTDSESETSWVALNPEGPDLVWLEDTQSPEINLLDFRTRFIAKPVKDILHHELKKVRQKNWPSAAAVWAWDGETSIRLGLKFKHASLVFGGIRTSPDNLEEMVRLCLNFETPWIQVGDTQRRLSEVVELDERTVHALDNLLTPSTRRNRFPTLLDIPEAHEIFNGKINHPHNEWANSVCEALSRCKLPALFVGMELPEDAWEVIRWFNSDDSRDVEKSYSDFCRVAVNCVNFMDAAVRTEMQGKWLTLVKRTLDVEKLRELFRRVTAQVPAEEPKPSGAIRKWLFQILNALPIESRSACITDRYVPTVDGKWHLSNSVVLADDSHIDESQRLHADWSSLFEPFRPSAKPKLSETLKTLRDSQQVSTDLIADLLALLTHGQLFPKTDLHRKVVSKIQTEHATVNDMPERFREIMFQAELPDAATDLFREANKQVVFYTDSDSFLSITGKPFTPLRKKEVSRFRSISTGRSADGWDFLEIGLFEFPEDESAQEAVKETIIKLVENISVHFRTSKPNMYRLRSFLGERANQSLDIRVANSLMRVNLAQTLKRLRAGDESEPIQRAIREFESHQVRYENARLRAGNGTPDKYNHSGALNQSLDEIIKLIKENPKSVLKSLRAHLKLHNYSETQTIFELYQNADDAISQLATDEIVDSRVRIVLDVPQRVVTFEHYGRLINGPGQDANPATSRHDPMHWKRDLLNMLEVGVSSKGESETGRFGLGFKSVYLLTDRPKVQSGSLAFEVVGGLLLEQDNPSLNYRKGMTRFSLKLRDAVSDQQADACFKEFVRLAPLLVTFAQRATHLTGLRIEELSKVAFEANLQDSEFSSEAGGCTATILPRRDESEPSWLYLRPSRAPAGPRLQILFALEGSELRVPASDVPRVWVTVPTQEDAGDLGFVMGGPFAVDVGRSRLALKHEATNKTLNQLSDLLESAVRGLAGCELESFEFGPAIDLRQLRSSLFVVLTANLRPLAPGAEPPWHERFVREALERLQDVPLIPDQDGQLHKRDGLTRLHSHLSQLSEKDSGFREWLNTRAVPRAVPLASQVCDRVALLKDGGRVTVEPLLETVSKSLGTEPLLGLDQEAQRRHLCALALLLETVPSENREGVLDFVGALMVPTQDGEGCALRDVYVRDVAKPEGSDDHEVLKMNIVARLAPDDRLLDEARMGEELKTELLPAFRKHRPWSLNPDEVIEWVAEGKLTTDDQRLALAELLVLLQVDNKLQTAMQDHAKRPGWLNEALMNKAGGALKNQGVTVTDQHIGAAVYGCGIRTYERTVEAAPQQLHPWRLLKDWWDVEANAAKARRDYFDTVYAGAWPGSQDGLVTALKESDDPEHMKAWMTMFLIAMSFKVGRVTEEQIRRFVKLSYEWIRTAADPASNEATWIAAIDNSLGAKDPLDPKDEYFHWMQLFPSLRAAWMRSPNWIELAHNQSPQMRDPFEILGPSFSAGSGLGAARPLKKVLGRIGSVWLCRELVRLGVWNAEGIKYDFYVPWKFHTLYLLGFREKPRPTALQVTSAVEELLLCERPFGNDFDLPVQLLKMRYDPLWAYLSKKLTPSSKDQLEGQSEIEDAEPEESELE
jgi:hypothetical protein